MLQRNIIWNLWIISSRIDKNIIEMACEIGNKTYSSEMGSLRVSGRFTIGSKIIRALEIIRVKKFILNAVIWSNYLLRNDL